MISRPRSASATDPEDGDPAAVRPAHLDRHGLAATQKREGRQEEIVRADDLWLSPSIHRSSCRPGLRRFVRAASAHPFALLPAVSPNALKHGGPTRRTVRKLVSSKAS